MVILIVEPSFLAVTNAAEAFDDHLMAVIFRNTKINMMTMRVVKLMKVLPPHLFSSKFLSNNSDESYAATGS